MLTFTKIKNARLTDSVHNAGVVFPTLYLHPYFMNGLLLFKKGEWYDRKLHNKHPVAFFCCVCMLHTEKISF
jgi:hypothetical protein